MTEETPPNLPAQFAPESIVAFSSEGFTSYDWYVYLKKSGLFPVEVTEPFIFMDHYQTGLEWIFKRKKVGNGSLVFPQTGFIPETRPDIPLAVTSDDGKTILFALDQLLAMSSPQRAYLIKDTNGPTFHGTFNQLFELVGVEEGSHAAFSQLPQTSPLVPHIADRSNTARYDASDIEFTSLQDRISYCKTQGYSQLKSDYEQRLRAAEQVRATFPH